MNINRNWWFKLNLYLRTLHGPLSSCWADLKCRLWREVNALQFWFVFSGLYYIITGIRLVYYYSHHMFKKLQVSSLVQLSQWINYCWYEFICDPTINSLLIAYCIAFFHLCSILHGKHCIELKRAWWPALSFGKSYMKIKADPIITLMRHSWWSSKEIVRSVLFSVMYMYS